MTDELRLERVIDAPPDVVFDAFTTDGGQMRSGLVHSRLVPGERVFGVGADDYLSRGAMPQEFVLAFATSRAAPGREPEPAGSDPGPPGD